MRNQLLALSVLAVIFTAPAVVAQHDGHAQSGHARQGTQVRPQTNSEEPSKAVVPQADRSKLTLVGQDAFAAVQQIVRILEADPTTDWARVNIDALREHLVDMHFVMLYAEVESERIDGGMRYIVTGDTKTAAAIARMVTSHAHQVSAHGRWSATASERKGGVALEVTSSEAREVERIRGLGFSGFMVQGDHHQPHHLRMAKGALGQHHH